MKQFVYTPLSGDRMFARNPVHGCDVVDLPNASHLVVGTFAVLTYDTANPGQHWRHAAIDAAKAVVAAFGGAAWDANGTVEIAVPPQHEPMARDLMAIVENHSAAGPIRLTDCQRLLMQSVMMAPDDEPCSIIADWLDEQVGEPTDAGAFLRSEARTTLVAKTVIGEITEADAKKAYPDCRWYYYVPTWTPEVGEKYVYQIGCRRCVLVVRTSVSVADAWRTAWLPDYRRWKVRQNEIAKLVERGLSRDSARRMVDEWRDDKEVDIATYVHPSEAYDGWAAEAQTAEPQEATYEHLYDVQEEMEMDAPGD